MLTHTTSVVHLDGGGGCGVDGAPCWFSLSGKSEINKH